MYHSNILAFDKHHMQMSHYYFFFYFHIIIAQYFVSLELIKVLQFGYWCHE